MDFRWNDWNLEHATQHGVTTAEAEAVVLNAVRPFPRRVGEDQWLVWGRGSGGRMLQVSYVVDPDGTVFIVHARPLTETERRAYRKRGSA